MVNTILFDLDGTLLQFSQKEFLDKYFFELTTALAKTGLDAKKTVDAVWAGTMAMAKNDGTVLNRVRFWKKLSEALELSDDEAVKIEAICDSFYVNEFDRIKVVLRPNDAGARLVHTMKAKGYEVVLATNPFFPLCAVETRLAWIGLKSSDFALVTHYGNSSFCKPNPAYYNEVMTKIGKTPQQCFMAGNNPTEDMVPGTMGAETFLVTDCLENEAGLDISPFRKGTLEDLTAHLTALPDVVEIV